MAASLAAAKEISTDAALVVKLDENTVKWFKPERHKNSLQFTAGW